MLNHMILFRAAMTRPEKQQARTEVHGPPRVIRTLALTLALAGGATLMAAPVATTGAQAFGLGDVWDAAKEVGGAVKDVTDAARGARNKVQNTVRDAAGNAIKEVGGKVYDSIEDKIPSGVKRLGNDMKGAGELVGKMRDDYGAVKGLPGRALDRWREHCPKIVGCDFEPVAGPASESSPYKPGEWGGNAAPLDSVGPTKSQAIAGSNDQADKDRNMRAIWKNADKAVRQRAERNEAGAQSTKSATIDHQDSKIPGKAVTKGTDTGNPSKAARDRSAAGRPLGEAKDRIPRDRSAMGRPLGEAKDRVPRDRSAAGRPVKAVPKPAGSAPVRTGKPARGKQIVIRDKHGKTTVVRDKRSVKKLMPKRVKRMDHRAKRQVDHRAKRKIDHRAKRKIDHRPNRKVDHRANRTVDHRNKRVMNHRSSRKIEKPRNRGVQMRNRDRRG